MFSDTGGRVGYIAGRADRFFAVVDGREHEIEFPAKGTRPQPHVSRLVFSPDGRRWAAVVSRVVDDASALWAEYRVIVDGRAVGDLFRVLLRRLDREVIAADLQSVAINAGIRDVTFSHDGQRLAYTVQDLKKAYVVVDGAPGKEYPRVVERSLHFTPNGKDLFYVVREGQKWRLVRNSTEYPPVGYFIEVLATNPDGRRLALNSGGHVQVVGPPKTQSAGPFAWVENRTFTFSPDGRRFAFVAHREKNKKYMVVSDRGAGREYAFAAWPVFSPDGRLAYVAQRFEDKKYTVVVEDQEGPLYDSAFEPLFSSDGKKMAYVAWITADNASVLLVNGQERARAWIVADPVFSPDGRHLAYTVCQGKGQPRRVVVDGQTVDDPLSDEGFDKLSKSAVVFDGPDTLHFVARRGEEGLCVYVGIGVPPQVPKPAPTVQAPAVPLAPRKPDSPESLAENVLAAMDTLVEVMKTINDRRTAEAARPKIRELRKRLSEAQDKLDKIGKPTPEVDAAIQRKYGEQMTAVGKRLEAEITRLEAIPGLMELIEAELAGKPDAK